LSVPGDDRRRATIATPIEPVVQTSPDDVIALTEKVVVVVEEEIVVVIGTTNVGVEVLDFDAQISEEGPFIAEGIFNARASCVADQPVVSVVIVVEEERTDAEQEWIEVVDPRTSAEGNTACAIDEEAVEGDTGAATHGAKEARVVDVVAEAEEVVVVIVVADEGLAVALDAQHELVDLPVYAGLAAAMKRALLRLLLLARRNNSGPDEDIVVRHGLGLALAAR